MDIHTHKQIEDAIISCEPDDFSPQAHFLYAVAIHPWNTTSVNEEQWQKLEAAANHPQVVAIGETGLDKQRGANMVTQLALLERHATLAEKHALPLLLHLVKSSNELLRWNRERQRSVPMIIHGFRGNKQIAKQLLEAGFYISFGEHYQLEALECTPINHLFIETDTAEATIESIYAKIAIDKKITLPILEKQVFENYRKLFLRDKSL
ncbi:MAG: TatD family hydrolase [Bacteroidaceae bacterium]|nr:TatD family hydrolase [Bacteroidaceae bacterium]